MPRPASRTERAPRRRSRRPPQPEPSRTDRRTSVRLAPLGASTTTTGGHEMSDSRSAFDAWIEAFNAHDEAAIRGVTADDCTFEGPGGVRLEGGDAVSGYAMVWLNAFSDAKLHVDQVLVDGDWVSNTGVFKGTHDGTLASPDGDVPATGRTLEGRCSQFVRFADGKAVEEHLYFDQIDVMTQLGLMPEAAGATA